MENQKVCPNEKSTKGETMNRKGRQRTGALGKAPLLGHSRAVFVSVNFQTCRIADPLVGRA